MNCEERFIALSRSLIDLRILWLYQFIHRSDRSRRNPSEKLAILLLLL